MTQKIPSSDRQSPRRAYARRGVLLGAFALGGMTAGGTALARWFNVAGSVSDGAISVTQAHEAAVSGDITLIDIRRPDEWALTDVGEGAVPLDMRDRAFESKLLSLVVNKDAAIALICARGVRSRGMTRRLTAAGFTNIIDVPEGMLGSGAGPGWVRTGLPMVKHVIKP